MSRCFPFPPPGCEKKARSDEVDLLKKEKDREKKHKKEKKDKERREGKEKEEKDKSDRKHTDKKDKREKHRDKKEKDRDKNKGKSSASDEKRLSGQAKLNNGDKALDERKPPVQPKHNNRDKALEERKFGEKSEANGREGCSQKGEDREVDRNNISSQKKFSGQFSGYNGQKISQNSNLSHHSKDSKVVQEVAKGAKDEDRNQFIEKFTGGDAKQVEGMGKLVGKAPGSWVERKEKDKKDGYKKWDGHGIMDEAKFIGSAQNLPKTFQAPINGILRPLEKDMEKTVEEREKSKQKESSRKDKEKKDREKDKVKDKQEEKEEKAKEKSEDKNKEPYKLNDSSKADFVGNHTVKTSHLAKKSINSAVDKVNLKKRKDSDTNGFLHANDFKPNKLRRPASLSPSIENGKMLGTCQIPTTMAQAKQEVVNSDDMDNKERRINGLIEVKALPISSTVQSPSMNSLTKPSNAQTDQITEVSRKQPPHPDSKYMAELLTVHKMEAWSDFDDQEWLFQSQTKKSKVGCSGVGEMPQVWSEAMHIESVDVYALPYVIPH